MRAGPLPCSARRCLPSGYGTGSGRRPSMSVYISKQGSDWLRWILCEAAQTAKRSPEFAVAYQRLAHRRGKKIATTAIARRLLARAYHLLRAVQDQRDQQGAR
ncbi:transposase [Streptomyces sp. NPDC056227]|uniref:transposase n=1 Tax=Streptomyces sp. NPDC056227 TaxID=3345753 RepID=UPI0035DE5908